MEKFRHIHTSCVECSTVHRADLLLWLRCCGKWISAGKDVIKLYMKSIDFWSAAWWKCVINLPKSFSLNLEQRGNSVVAAAVAVAASVIVLNSHVEQSSDSFNVQCIYRSSKRSLFKRFHYKMWMWMWMWILDSVRLCVPLGTTSPHHHCMHSVP